MKKTGGVETLHAIPWIFAWNQTRFLLPVWLGIGEAIKATFDSGKKETLVEMYNSWTFFRVAIDLVEIVLFKAITKVVKMYDTHLVDLSLKRLGEDLTNRFLETKKLLAEVTGHGTLGLAAKSANPLLSQKIKLRPRYVVPLNMLQIECLKDSRATKEEERKPEEEKMFQQIEGALIITIKGIAAGMQNTS